ncbi:unnamed protein product, partial [Discosporangium mesarthrocarpum]
MLHAEAVLPLPAEDMRQMEQAVDGPGGLLLTGKMVVTTSAIILLFLLVVQTAPYALFQAIQVSSSRHHGPSGRGHGQGYGHQHYSQGGQGLPPPVLGLSRLPLSTPTASASRQKLLGRIPPSAPASGRGSGGGVPRGDSGPLMLLGNRSWAMVGTYGRRSSSNSSWANGSSGHHTKAGGVGGISNRQQWQASLDPDAHRRGSSIGSGWDWGRIRGYKVPREGPRAGLEQRLRSLLSKRLRKVSG